MKNIKDRILDNIINQTYINPKFLKNNNLTAEECYDIVYNITNNNKKCKICGISKKQFISFKKGYKEVCHNKKCIYTNAKIKREKTNLKKYGCKHTSQVKEVKEKIKKTIFKKYGKTFSELMLESSYKNGVHCSQTKEAKLKREKTMLERYGTTDSLSINNGRERGIKKCISDENVIKKRKETNNKRYGGDTSFSSKKVQDKVKATVLKNYGYENIMYSKDFVENVFKKSCFIRDLKKKQDIDENGLNIFQRAGLKANEKRRITNEQNGNWITEDKIKDFRTYTKMVWRYTNQNDLSLLENYDKRGVFEDDYHLDHKYSIFQGFKDNVPASIIGNICNLEMLPTKENLLKNKKCSITLEKLLEMYND